MNGGAVYHRPESEDAYLYKKDKMHIKIRTGKGDIQKVLLSHGDPYTFGTKNWQSNGEEVPFLCETAMHDYWLIEVEADYHRIQYGFCLIDQTGQKYFYGDRGIFPYEEVYLKMPNLYFKLPYFHEIDRFKAPEWVRQTIWYQIFPDRFCNGDSTINGENVKPWNAKLPDSHDFFGGDIAGILSKLDYLKELGVNGLYLCPIFTAPSNHKYDTINYFEIDPHFGNKTLFKFFIETAHKKGFKIMLDAVFNHIGDHSPQWQDVIKNGENSKYADWFHISDFPVTYSETENPEYVKALTYDTFAFTPHMPKLNTANAEVRAYLLAIAKYWVEEFDIDAWRLDVANEVDHHFWKLFYQEICQVKKDMYILGEVWNSAQPWLQGDEFHGAMNYAYTEIIEQYFATKVLSGEQLIYSLCDQLMKYRKQTNEVMMNMLDSHDTPRLKTVCKEDTNLVHKMLSFLFLQPGVPCIFYGTELGITGGPDPDCRRCMDWEIKYQTHEDFLFMKKVISVRSENYKLLSQGSFVIYEPYKEIIVIERELEHKKIIGIFNQTQRDISLAGLPNNYILLCGSNEGEKLSENGWLILRMSGAIGNFRSSSEGDQLIYG